MKRFILAAVMTLGFASQGFAESWLAASNGYRGANSVMIGREGTVDTYVCRVGGSPGKLVPHQGKCYIGWYGQEYGYTSYEVLQDPSGRLRFFAGSALSDDYAVFGGNENGTPMKICRVRISAGFVGGKLKGSVQNGICYYGYYGREYSSRVFDALSNA